MRLRLRKPCEETSGPHWGVSGADAQHAQSELCRREGRGSENNSRSLGRLLQIVAFTHEREKVNTILDETRGFQQARAPTSRTDQSGALLFGDITRTNVDDLDEPFNG
jgi:hypothetical protein